MGGRSTEGRNAVKILREFWKDESGQDMVEYALMAGLVAVAAGAVIPPMAPSLSNIFSKVGSVLTTP
jgi:pilus assembly protein Flp/PilA